ncbi:MAG: phosphate ABC transporter substrate-binding protein [Chloroflexaceae bacterium]|nr:phosphate ABC transporter substrate-binding protein [Chloroflexaceae bacterium]
MFKTQILLTLMLVTVMSLGGCGASPAATSAPDAPAATSAPEAPAATSAPDAAADTSAPDAAELRGTIEIVGSTTVIPLVEQLREAFIQQYPGITVNVGAGGSVVGIEAVQDGRTDIGMSSRRLKPEEILDGMQLHPIALDVLAIIVHPSNPVEGITKEELQGIFKGEITNWSEVGGADQEILPVVREITSGTRGAFDDVALDGQEPTTNADVQITASEVEAKVASTENAIGYIGFGHIVQNEIRVITIDDVEPSPDSAKDGSYPLLRPLLLLTGPLSRDIANVFIEFSLSAEGQQIVVDDGWVPAVQN